MNHAKNLKLYFDQFVVYLKLCIRSETPNFRRHNYKNKWFDSNFVNYLLILSRQTGITQIIFGLLRLIYEL